MIGSLVVIDSCVLIKQIRKPHPVRGATLDSLQGRICGPIVTELLAGARQPTQVVVADAMMAKHTLLPISLATWRSCGELQARLLSANKRVPDFDALIAVTAVEHGASVWTYDNHFNTIAVYLPGLVLFQEPPGIPP